MSKGEFKSTSSSIPAATSTASAIAATGGTITTGKEQKPVIIRVRPWSILPKANPIAFLILDDRLLRVIFTAIEHVHMIVTQEEHPHKHKTVQSTMDKGMHMRLMDEFYAVKHANMQKLVDNQIAAQFTPSTIRPLFLNQAARRMEFRTCTDVEYKAMKKPIEASLPFVMPMPITLNDLNSLADNRKMWLWTFKLDGIRLYCIFMTVGSQKLMIWCNRKGKCWVLANKLFDVPDDFYQGVIFDCELTLDSVHNVMALTVHSCYCSRYVCGQLDEEYRLMICRHRIEEWNNLAPSNVKPVVPFLSAAYTIERWIQSNFVIRVKRFFSTRDIPFLLDRVMPSLEQNCDGLIGVTAEGSMTNRPKKIKNLHTIEFTPHLVLIRERKDGSKEGVYSIWTYMNRNLNAVSTVDPGINVSIEWIEWTEHGTLILHESNLLSNQTFEERHKKVVEVKIVEEDFVNLDNSRGQRKSVEFIRFRDHERSLPNSLYVVRRTIHEIRHQLPLDEIFPPILFEKGYRIEGAAEVLKLRVKKQLDWHMKDAETAAISLPAPLLVGDVSERTLLKQWKAKCSPYTNESLVYMQSRVA